MRRASRVSASVRLVFGGGTFLCCVVRHGKSAVSNDDIFLKLLYTARIRLYIALLRLCIAHIRIYIALIMLYIAHMQRWIAFILNYIE